MLVSGWGSGIPTEPTAVWPRGMERDGEGKWHRGVPAAMQAARHSPGNISQAVLFPQLLPFLSPSGKGLTGHSRNTRKILLRGCKFLAVLWSVEPLREKGPKCSQREQLLSRCPPGPHQGWEGEREGEQQREVWGQGIDLGSVFSELMERMENNMLSCYLTVSLLLTAERRKRKAWPSGTARQ